MATHVFQDCKTNPGQADPTTSQYIPNTNFLLCSSISDSTQWLFQNLVPFGYHRQTKLHRHHIWILLTFRNHSSLHVRYNFWRQNPGNCINQSYLSILSFINIQIIIVIMSSLQSSIFCITNQSYLPSLDHKGVCKIISNIPTIKRALYKPEIPTVSML